MNNNNSVKRVLFNQHRNLLSTIFFAFICVLVISCNKDLNNKESSNQNLKKIFNASRGNSGKPNIILIVGDDVGYEVPTYTGGESYQTPNIDMMARYGMQLTHCYTAPETSPTRFMMMTGKYNFRNYVTWGVMDPAANETIADMLQDAGYATCFTGKWQLGGGDPSIHALGFDKYSVYNCCIGAGGERGSRYKNPVIYQDGTFLPPSATLNKYGEDIFTDYMLKFIDRANNDNKPFFAMYCTVLAHSPFSPTPDDPEFAEWNPDEEKSKVEFYPSMIKYLDKKVGEIIRHLEQKGISKNTIILYVMGDNGCGPGVVSKYQGRTIYGGKDYPSEFGTHVPFVAVWPNRIAPGSYYRGLIDMTDFLPTLADIALIPEPTSYGTLDGVSFYPQLKGNHGTPREWIFCHYIPQLGNYLLRWIQDTTYKLYDSKTYNDHKGFYNWQSDTLETNPLENNELNSYEKLKRIQFQSVLDTMHK